MEGRCPWASDELLAAYHDAEWGVPIRDDRLLFELLVLEGAQAGLSWRTVLARRDGYRSAYQGFDPATVARFTDRDVERLLGDPGIIRNRSKVESSIGNAQSLLAIAEASGSFSDFLWDFVGGTQVRNSFTSMTEIPAETELSRTISKALRAAGMRFVGPTIVYAYLQSAGLVLDHLVSCPRWSALGS